MIAIYARQSVDKDDSFSIETQIEYCTNYIKSKPTKEKIQVYEDKGFSGKNIHRPAFEEMMYEVKAGRVSKIVVYKLDRISRNLLDFEDMYKIFKAKKVQFCSVNETFDTSTPIGRSMLRISMVFAQMERESIQLRVKDNYYKRIEDGRWAGGPAPYGFKKGRLDKAPTLIVDEHEMTAVAKMFDWYEEEPNISLGQIGKRLSELGYVGRKRKTFDNVTIARILKNPVYCKADKILYKFYENKGMNFINEESEWNGTRAAAIVGKKIEKEIETPTTKKGSKKKKDDFDFDIETKRQYTKPEEQYVYLTNFSGLVSSRTFIKVQERLALNQQIKRANAPSRMEELAGLVKCGKCQQHYAIKMYNAKKLDCYGNRSLHLCDATFKTVDFEEVRKQVLEKVKEWLANVDKIKAEEKEKQDEVRRKVGAINRKIENLRKLAEDDEEMIAEVRARIKELQKERNNMQIDVHTHKLNNFMLEDIKYLDYDKVPVEVKKNIYRQLINKIYLYEDGSIQIEWKK